jgi:hemerythrin-like domain-containing protein
MQYLEPRYNPRRETMSILTSKIETTDAIKFLIDEHRAVKKLFDRVNREKESASLEQKNALVQEICTALWIHMEIEKTIFYPEVQPYIGTTLISEYNHDSIRELIHRINAISASDSKFECYVKVLNQQFDLHIDKEEGEVFPEIRDASANLDLIELGSRLMEMKKELAEEYAALALCMQ